MPGYRENLKKKKEIIIKSHGFKRTVTFFGLFVLMYHINWSEIVALLFFHTQSHSVSH